MAQQPLTWDAPGLTWDNPNLTWDGFMPVSSNNTVMPTDNRISASIAAADKTTILNNIAGIRALLPPVNLTGTEKSELPQIGDKSLAFDTKCAAYMVSNPTLVPGFVDTAELQKDRALMVDLADIARELSTLLDTVKDGLALCGHEALMADLSFYQSVRQAAKRGVPGADVIYNDLKLRYPGRPKTPPQEPEAPTA